MTVSSSNVSKHVSTPRSSLHLSEYSLSMALHDEDHSLPSTYEYDAIKPAAEFVLALRQGHHISQSALNMIIENTEMLLQSTLSIIKTQLHAVLRKNGLDLEEALGNEDIFQNVMPLFDGVSTLSRQRHYFLQNFGLLVSMHLYKLQE